MQLAYSENLKNFLKNKFFRFIASALLLYLCWLIAYEVWIHPHTNMDRLVIDNIIFFSGKLLSIIGYDLIPTPPVEASMRTVGIDGSHGIWIGDPCNGLALFSLFLIFIITYPGRLINKFWFAPLGLILIHLINILRVTSLAIIAKENPNALYFNHTYTFTIIVYCFVFFLWYLWATKLATYNRSQY